MLSELKKPDIEFTINEKADIEFTNNEKSDIEATNKEKDDIEFTNNKEADIEVINNEKADIEVTNNEINETQDSLKKSLFGIPKERSNFSLIFYKNFLHRIIFFLQINFGKKSKFTFF